MCGIVGIISNKTIDKSNLEQMNDTMIHRGPDGHGVYLDNGFGFGHRRLAIVDLSDHGHQPMHYKERYTITYNGEVYNHIELRDELEKAGYQFVSHTDTEVIMAAYDYWGIESFNRFNGMWAFCIYDKQNNEYIFSRDRFGIKPLYYYYDGESFVFASEIKAILKYKDIKPIKPNIDYLNIYLEEGPREYLKETAFSDIFRFDFNSYIIAKKEDLLKGDLEFKEYWSVKPNISNESFDEKKLQKYAKEYYELLKDSVKLRLRADVKVGSALSGGIDSSSIVSLINEVHSEEGKLESQETFSSVYKSEGTTDCDESVYIDELAKYLNVKSNQIEPKSVDIPTEHEKMIYNMENPPSGTCMSGWHTFKLVRSTDIAVTLDGQGADEQLAGYEGYITNYIANIGLIDAFKSYRKIENQEHKRRAKKGIVVNLLSKILGKENSIKLLSKKFSDIEKYVIPLNQKLSQDMIENLITLIHYSDRVSMGNSIESRMPFMDYRLIDFLANIPASYKFHENWSKYLSRVAMDKKLPQSILWRKDKMGWPIPEKFWFEGVHKNWIRDKITNSEFLETEFKSYVNKFDNLSLQNKIKLLNIAVWSELFWKK